MALQDHMPAGYHLDPDKWVILYADMLYRYVSSRVTNAEAAEDIVQETFLSAWQARVGYKGSASEKNWLFAICKNKVIDYYRKEAKEIATHLSSLQQSRYFNENDSWESIHLPKEWAVNYNQTIEEKEFYRILAYCKDKLHELQRAVFVLKYIDDMPSDEICKELEISSSNYWTLMHRAKLQLRGCMEKSWLGL